jgi:hypothetical protein
MQRVASFKRLKMIKFWCFAFLFFVSSLQAGEVFKVATRTGVTTEVFWHETPNARATVLVFPGGDGGFGGVQSGMPMSRNFLVRTAPYWTAEPGVNYAVFGLPSDSNALDYAERISPAHLTDVREVLRWLHTKMRTPLWLVGTSRGTVSAAAALIQWKDLGIAGAVLSSSITASRSIGSLPSQDLAQIKVPVLLVHHESDRCDVSRPGEVPLIMKGLVNAPVKKLIMITGGSGASGNPCRALHYHGYAGVEQSTVQAILAWIREPSAVRDK